MTFSLAARSNASPDLSPRPSTLAAVASLPLVGATIVLGIGLAILLFRALRPEAVGTPIAFPLMVPASAAGLMLGSGSFLLMHRYRSVAHPGVLTAARVTAGLCMLLGIAAFVAFGLAGWMSAPEGVRAPIPWSLRPPANAAVNFVLLGSGLLALSSHHDSRRRHGRRLAAAVLVVCLMSLVTVAYGASNLHGFSRFGGMAVSTAISFGIVALGMLFFELDRGIAAIFVSESTGGRLMRRLGPAALLVPSLLGWLRLTAESAGLADDAFGLAVFVVTLVVVFVWLLINQAAALHTFDIERTQLHMAERGARAEAESAQHAAERAQREANQANQAKSVFLATMSHEIRTPINAIVGYGQLMELGVAGPITPMQRDYLGRLAATSEHLRSVIDDVLDLSKIDAGGMHVAHDVGMTGPLVAAALDLVRPQASAKSVRLVDARPEDVGEPFIGDEHRVRQILANLLSNAVKFTEAGGTITVDCGRAERTQPGTALLGAGPWTFVRVGDTGIGIPTEELASIFEPFHQVEHGNTRKQGGTGLGLTISRRLAWLMGGDLTVVSTPSRGSEFTLWLPAAEQVALPETAESARSRHATGAMRVHGLSEVGMHLREHLEEVLQGYATRLRAEPSLPNAAFLRRSEIEDHKLSFLADVAHTLVVVEETGGSDSDLLRDGSTIQRVVAELHGAMRHRRGWTEAQLKLEYSILDDEIASAVRRSVGEGEGDVSLALDVLHRLVDRARTLGVNALRRAAEGEDADEGAR